MNEDRPGGELPPLKLRPKRRLLPELELDLRLPRRRDDLSDTTPPPSPPPPVEPDPEETTDEIGEAETFDLAQPVEDDVDRAADDEPSPDDIKQPPAMSPIQRLATPLTERPSPESDPPTTTVADQPPALDEPAPDEPAPPPAVAESIADQVVTLPAPLPPPLPPPPLPPSLPATEATPPPFVALPAAADVLPPPSRRARRAQAQAAKKERAPRPPKAKRSAKAAKPDTKPDSPPAGPRPRKAPLYWRVLRLRHVHPNGWQRAVLLEGMIGAAVVLVLAGKASLWTLLALPVVAATLVKLHDVLMGSIAAAESGQQTSTRTRGRAKPAKQKRKAA